MRAAGFPESIFVQTDVTQDEDCENLVTRALETFGKLDGAFNNAGISMEADKQARKKRDDSKTRKVRT